MTAPLRQVEVFDIQILDWQGGEKPELAVAIACGPGTYIRSIARDLGEVLGTGATLAQLTRTLSCGFALADSLTFEVLADQVQAGTFTPIEPSFSLQQPILHLPPAEAQRFCWGQKLPQDLPEGMMQVHTCDRFLGMGEILAGVLKPKLVLPPASK